MIKFIFVTLAVVCIVPLKCDPVEEGPETSWLFVAASRGKDYKGDCSAFLNITEAPDCERGSKSAVHRISINRANDISKTHEGIVPIVRFETLDELRAALSESYDECTNAKPDNLVFYFNILEPEYALFFATYEGNKEAFIAAMSVPAASKVQDLIKKAEPFVAALDAPPEWQIGCQKADE